MIYLPGELYTVQASRLVTKFQALPYTHWHYSQFHKERKTETLGIVVKFKIATRVGLPINIHKQYCQLMTKQNVFRKNYLSFAS